MEPTPSFLQLFCYGGSTLELSSDSLEATLRYTLEAVEDELVFHNEIGGNLLTMMAEGESSLIFQEQGALSYTTYV